MRRIRIELHDGEELEPGIDGGNPVDLVMELCNHVIVMDQGTKLAEGTPDEIQANPAVLDAYLGN